MKKRIVRVMVFLGIMALTIILSRIIVSINDPNILLGGYELHHFYYGLLLLMILNLSFLFGHNHPRLYLVLSGIAFGLISDEFLFILGGFSNAEYASTIPQVLFTVLVLLLILVIILYDFLHHKRKHEKRS